MYGTGTRGIRNVQDDGRGLPYRFVSEDWFGGWAAAPGGFRIDANGTPGDDVFTGTDANEEYHGLGGNDTIDGAGGRDRLFGDEGNDTIYGGEGGDFISGSVDDPFYDGDDGDDMIDGGRGNDVIQSGNGRNVVYGGDGNDQITVYADDGDGSRFYGGDGDDYLSADHSTLIGGRGDDYLWGYQSNIKGGGGNDHLRIGGPFLVENYRNEVWGGAGADTFEFTTGTSDLLGGYQVIHDLWLEDYIDLSSIDANERKIGDQAFTLVSESSGKPGEMTILRRGERCDAHRTLYRFEL